ncbi:transglycosylase domain-containing protein, partial [Bacillus altitudinis]|uniref:transglycosylase domain-containing protein n=1 Tax=Bacillus altitudinis TaxID=293387 RepID=UPI00307CD4F9
MTQPPTTITQHLSPNLYLTHQPSFSPNFTQLLYSYDLHRKFTKDQILQTYLNTIYFTNPLYPLASPPNYYFHNPLTSFTLPHIPFISPIPNNPTLYHPFKKFKHTNKPHQPLLRILQKHALITNKQF